jgi:peroxiredoxin-like protein
MHPYPHLYKASASGSATGSVAVSSSGLPTLESAPPPEFDGPGGAWSPETLLCAAVADCFILTFRAVTRGGRLEWSKLDCRVEGTLDRQEGVAMFKQFVTRAELTVPAGTDVAKARTLLEKAEHACLIANSLRGDRALEVTVTVA